MMQAKHRSRRLRKKLRVGEFQEFGFEASFQLRPELPKEELENFWDAFILEAIERNGLVLLCVAEKVPDELFLHTARPATTTDR